MLLKFVLSIMTKKGKFVVYVHESNRFNFMTISQTAVRLCWIKTQWRIFCNFIFNYVLIKY